MTTQTNHRVQTPDLVAPNDQAAEESVLGSILINPDCAGAVFSVLGATSDFFYLRNQWVYEAIQALSEAGEAIDNVTVALQIKMNGHEPGDFGGSIEAFLNHLGNSTPTHIHAETYARFVRKLAARRKLLALAGDIATAAQDGNISFEQAIDRAEQMISRVAEYGTPARFEHVSEPLARIETMIAEQLNAEGRYVIPSISTGLKCVDRRLQANGFERSDLVIIAGLRASGKTSYMMQLAVHAAEQGYCTAVLSLEMQNDSLALRMVANQTGINAKNFVNGLVRDRQYEAFASVQAKLNQTRLWLTDDVDASNVNRLEGQLRRLRDLNDGCLDIVFVDYAQIMSIDGQAERRNLEVAAITRELKRIAKRLNIVIVVGSQLNSAYAELLRGAQVNNKDSKRPDTPPWPEPQNLAESSSLGNDADTALAIIHWTDRHAKRRTFVYCIKQRKGEDLWHEELIWTPGLTAFSEKEDVSQKPLNLV